MITYAPAAAAIRFVSLYDSPLGKITLLSDGDFLVGLYFPTQLAALLNQADWIINDDIFDDAKAFLDKYFAASPPKTPPAMRLLGTPFQRRVWTELLKIPLSQTRTYGQVAEAISQPTASRAVGKAIGDNPISIIVPCHRVIGANGSLTGYAGGLSIKQSLLRHEGHL